MSTLVLCAVAGAATRSAPQGNASLPGVMGALSLRCAIRQPARAYADVIMCYDDVV